MTQRTNIRFNMDGLAEFKKQMGAYRARVGVLGSNAARKDDASGLDNATIGVIQIFGSMTMNIPPRDFLMMPIQSHGKEIVQALGKSSVQENMAKGDYGAVFTRLGAEGEKYVHMAFDTAGFGQWPPNAPMTIRLKGSSAPLIDTRQLERAVSSEVVKSGQASGSGAPVAGAP